MGDVAFLTGAGAGHFFDFVSTVHGLCPVPACLPSLRIYGSVSASALLAAFPKQRRRACVTVNITASGWSADMLRCERNRACPTNFQDVSPRVRYCVEIAKVNLSAISRTTSYPAGNLNACLFSPAYNCPLTTVASLGQVPDA